ncbi:hypothetical protein FRC06_005898 [Ceratobasidium sp. 370]|nr:hypothetical protein FRC06_005898 [Ceratobasidium sp. 370]
MAASIAIRIAYGYKVDSADDHFVQCAEELMAAFSDGKHMLSSPAKWAVNVLPLLRYLPEWFPLAAFQRRAQYVRRLDTVTKAETFEYVVKQMLEGTAEDSFTSKLLQPEDGQPIDDETKEQIKSIAATLYGAGSDTTVSGVQSFFLAMTLYPDVQAKAQAEITEYLRQRSINGDSPRMILPADRPNLPYTSGLAQEILRWHPINYVFGFGRRICPGLHIAQQSMWISISNTLANFMITKTRDENGLEITPEERYSSGIIR